jgi:hypothetical protein
MGFIWLGTTNLEARVPAAAEGCVALQTHLREDNSSVAYNREPSMPLCTICLYVCDLPITAPLVPSSVMTNGGDNVKVQLDGPGSLLLWQEYEPCCSSTPIDIEPLLFWAAGSVGKAMG